MQILIRIKKKNTISERRIKMSLYCWKIQFLFFQNKIVFTKSKNSNKNARSSSIFHIDETCNWNGASTASHISDNESTHLIQTITQFNRSYSMADNKTKKQGNEKWSNKKINK